MTPLLRDMIALHDGNVDEPRRELAAAGEMPDDEGSFMAVVRATIMDMRSLFNGLYESVLPGLIDGENPISRSTTRRFGRSRRRMISRAC